MHIALTRRTQLLLDEERYRRLEERSAATGRSVASLIREAIDAALEEGDHEARAQAGRRLLSAPLPAGEEPDWEESKREMLDSRGA
jgi:predicted DNA-binding protein